MAAFDGRNKISLGLQREQEIPIDWQISAQEADVLKQVDELVAESSAVIQFTEDDQVVTAEGVN